MSNAAYDSGKALKNNESDDFYEDNVVDQEEDDHSKNIFTMFLLILTWL